MDFDQILSRYVGEFGRFQVIVLAVQSIEKFFMPMATLITVFIAAVPDFWCEDFQNVGQSAPLHLTTTASSQIVTSSNVSDNALNHVNDQCLKFHFADESSLIGRSSSPVAETLKCQKWQYSQDRYTSTIVTEWDLVCGRAWLVGTASAVFMAGMGTGSILFGYLADRFGRRCVVLVGGLVSLICSLACAAAPNVTFFLIMRFLMATFSTGKTASIYVMVAEYVGPSWRVFTGTVTFLFWCLGYVTLAGMAYFIRDWRTLVVVTSLPVLTGYIPFYFLVPESPRWLLSRNREAEAKAIIIRMAKVNKARLPEDLNLRPDVIQPDKIPRSYNVLDLFRTPQLRMLSFNVIFNWFSEGLVYYGLSLNTSNLGGNPYLNFAIAGAVEIPAYTLTPVACRYLGRLIPLAGCLILGGLALLAIAPVPTDMAWLIISLSMMGKFFITASFSLMWIYCCEAYPTCIRNQGLLLTSVAARVASVIASYVGLLAVINTVLPLLILGVFSITAGLLVFFLPETKDQPLRKSIAESEIFIKSNKLWAKKKSDVRGTIGEEQLAVTELLR